MCARELCTSKATGGVSGHHRGSGAQMSPRGVLVATVVAVVTPGLTSSSPSPLRAILNIALFSSFSSLALLTYFPQEMSPRSQ